MRHGSSNQAIDNALTLFAKGALNTGELNISGHGNSGLIETGMGQNGPWDLGKIILNWNETVWGPIFERIVPAPVTQITLWACHTGEGDPGSDLIFAMAKRAQRGVRAGTGFLYTNGQSIWWENGTVIQVATPTYRPPAHAAPSPHSFAGAPMEFESAGERFTTRLVQGISFAPNLPGKKLEFREIKGNVAAADIVEKLFAGQALDMSDVSVAGFITGTLKVDLGGGKEVVYTIYNDRLAVQQDTREGHYLLISPRTIFESFM